MFGDTVVAAALLDRLLHHVIVIEIADNSYWLREHAKLVPDGTEDGVIEVSNAAGQPGSWKIVGEKPGDRSGVAVSAPENVGGDGNTYVAIHSTAHRVEGAGFGAVYLLSTNDFSTADAAGQCAWRVDPPGASPLKR